MKVSVSHGAAKTKTDEGIRMMIWEMNPGTLHLKVGLEFYIMEPEPRTREMRKKYVKIRKLYPHHALCLVNGVYHECYTYSELYMMAVGNNGRA